MNLPPLIDWHPVIVVGLMWLSTLLPVALFLAFVWFVAPAPDEGTWDDEWDGAA